MDQSPNWQQQQRGGGRGNNWYSPQYNNRSPGGGGGGYSQWQSSPRHSNYNKNWRGSPYRTQSPYRYNRGRHSSNYSPRPQFYTSFDSDTGAEGQQESPHKQTPKSYGNAGADDIEQWVNPGMWQDPWARLMPIPQTTSKNETNDIPIAISNPHADAISSLTNLETKEDTPPPESDANTSKGQVEDVVDKADEDIEDS